MLLKERQAKTRCGNMMTENKLLALCLERHVNVFTESTFYFGTHSI